MALNRTYTLTQLNIHLDAQTVDMYMRVNIDEDGTYVADRTYVKNYNSGNHLEMDTDPGIPNGIKNKIRTFFGWV